MPVMARPVAYRPTTPATRTNSERKNIQLASLIASAGHPVVASGPCVRASIFPPSRRALGMHEHDGALDAKAMMLFTSMAKSATHLEMRLEHDAR